MDNPYTIRKQQGGVCTYLSSYSSVVEMHYLLEGSYAIWFYLAYRCIYDSLDPHFRQSHTNTTEVLVYK